jgi:hypothetical protein
MLACANDPARVALPCRMHRPNERRRSRFSTVEPHVSTRPDDDRRAQVNALRDTSAMGGLPTQTAAPRRVPRTCHTPERAVVNHGHSRTLLSRLPGPAFTQVRPDALAPNFQAGHAGSIPVIRSVT